MKYLVYFIAIVVALSSCKSKKHISHKFIESQNITETSVKPILEEEEKEIDPIIVKEEIVTAVEPAVEKSLLEKYYVILGSFRVLENAKKHQNQLTKEGFESQILRNEEGLYRVSVFSYIHISVAREKVLQIRKQTPKYHDAWVLRKLN